MDVEKLLLYLDKYWDSVLFKVKTDSNTHNIYAYSSRTGKFVYSNKLHFVKIRNFNHIDFLLWESILKGIKSSKDVFLSGGLYLKYDNYKKLCSRRSYQRSKKKFLELKLLLPTPDKKYFIINPYYICKINNLKIEK